MEKYQTYDQFNEALVVLEKFQEDGYVFRGQACGDWFATPNAFRDTAREKFKRNFQKVVDCSLWTNSDEARNILKIYYKELNSAVIYQHRLICSYILYLMQYNYSMAKFYLENTYAYENEIIAKTLNLRIDDIDYLISKDRFLKGLGHFTNLIQPIYRVDGSILKAPYFDQEKTSFDETWPQHYGFQTSALDVSKNLFKALYFIYPDEDYECSYFSIYCYKEKSHSQRSVQLMEPSHLIRNERAEAQEGMFIYFNNQLRYFMMNNGKLPSLDDYRQENSFELYKINIKRTVENIRCLKEVLYYKGINEDSLLLSKKSDLLPA